MRKKQLEGKRYPPTTRPSPILQDFYDKDSSFHDNRTLPEDIRQQLRVSLEELEHHRLTSDLEVQKRLLLEQQLKTLRQEYQEERQEKEQLKKELMKLSKKYGKAKQKKDCQKCKSSVQLSAKLQKERQIYFNDRKILQDEIKVLKSQLQNSQALQQRQKLLILTDSLKKEIYLGGKKIEQQARMIQFLNEKLSMFQVENVQIMNNVELLENKLSQIQIDTAIRKKQNKPCPNCCLSAKPKPRRQQDQIDNSNLSLGKRRRNGSIQNIKRGQREEACSELQRYGQ